MQVVSSTIEIRSQQKDTQASDSPSQSVLKDVGINTDGNFNTDGGFLGF